MRPLLHAHPRQATTAMGQAKYRNRRRPRGPVVLASALALHRDVLDAPRRWSPPAGRIRQLDERPVPRRRPSRLHQSVFAVMNEAPQHLFQVLTKRSDGSRALADELPGRRTSGWACSVEAEAYASRLDDLRTRCLRRSNSSPPNPARPAARPRSRRHRLGDRGGGSGPGARPDEADWVTGLRDRVAGSGAVLLQTVGRHQQEEGRRSPRRPDLGRDADPRARSILTMAPRGWGYWTEAKLDILSKYLQAFTTASKSAGKTVLDLFAGSATNQRRDILTDILGSSIRALRTEPRFDRLLLFELSDVAASLDAYLRAQFPERPFRVIAGDCNETMASTLAELRSADLDWAPTLAFVDPYSTTSVRWTTLAAVADFKRQRKYKIELWSISSGRRFRVSTALPIRRRTRAFQPCSGPTTGC